MTGRRWLVVGLGVICLVQLALLGSGWRTPSGPTVGRPLPNVGAVDMGDGSRVPWSRVVADGRACTLMVFVEPTCAECRAMRDGWKADASAWIDSVGAPVRVLWLTAADSVSMRDFVAGYDLGAMAFGRVVGSPNEIGRRLGIYGTPTLYLLDRSGALRVGALGYWFPPVDSGRVVCGSQ